MIQMFISDLGRMLRLRSAWALYGLVIAIILIGALKTQHTAVQSLYIALGIDSFSALLPAHQSSQLADTAWTLFTATTLWQSSTLVRTVASAGQHSYLVLAVATVVGVFYSHKIASHYEAIQTSRGLSRSKVVAANALSVAVYSGAIASVAVLVQLLVFFLAGGTQCNPLWTAMVAGEAVPFFPQLLTPSLAYVAIIILSTATTMFFLSALAYLTARITHNFVAAAVIPVALVWVWRMIFVTEVYPLVLISYLTFDFLAYSADTASDALAYPLGYLALGLGIFAALIGYSVLATVLRTRHGRTHR